MYYYVIRKVANTNSRLIKQLELDNCRYLLNIRNAHFINGETLYFRQVIRVREKRRDTSRKPRVDDRNRIGIIFIVMLFFEILPKKKNKKSLTIQVWVYVGFFGEKKINENEGKVKRERPVPLCIRSNFCSFIRRLHQSRPRRRSKTR